MSIGTIGSNYTMTAAASGRTTATSSTFNIVAATGTAMRLAFTTQPNNFLTWSLSVSKGFSGVVASASGATSSGTPSQLTRQASALLGTCVQAAFAVNLYTRAEITNGYGLQTQYDRSATIAFALLHP